MNESTDKLAQELLNEIISHSSARDRDDERSGLTNGVIGDGWITFHLKKLKELI